MNIDVEVISVDPPPCLGHTNSCSCLDTNLPEDKQSRRTWIETMLTIIRRSISPSILKMTIILFGLYVEFCLAFCSKQKGPQVPSCCLPFAAARCFRPKNLSYRDLSSAASRSLDSEGDAGGSLSETHVLVIIEKKTYCFFSQSGFLSSAASSTVT